MAQHLQRPGAPLRTQSASSFAEGFSVARNQVDKDIKELADLEEGTSPDSDSNEAPSLTVSGDATPASSSTPLTGPTTPSLDPAVADDFAFAFDIDGVLIRGGSPIPEAIEAMKELNGENEYGVRVPYIFLTNGGGKSEEERCRDLSKQLELEVSPGQFICGHTPMREMANKYRTVLVVGGEGEKCREVAEAYGFRDVITPGDILKANHHTAPFRKMSAVDLANSRNLLERGAMSDIVIEAIFVFADSRDWASDLQIILDIACSKGGRLETRSETFEEYPPIYFSHNDIIWSASHEYPRLGMGALRSIVEHTFESITGGKKLKTHAFGKPQVSTFEFATRLLQQWRANQHGLVDGKPPRTVYFVGDTPESDVRGTNAMDAKSKEEWYSILVKT
ncbi:HAD-superfamily hydrolase, partial [Cryphonectria parasitica EP155]